MQGSRRSPLWARLVLAIGIVLAVSGGGTAIAGVILIDRYQSGIEQQDLFGGATPGPGYGEDLDGPMNILLAGLDTRPSRPNETPRADAIVVVHITEELDRAYLLSLPRDTLVDVPPLERAEFPGASQRKLAEAMYYGADPVDGEETPNIARGFELLSRTASDLTGIGHFDAGAVINFTGFKDIVDAIGNITVTLDERIVSRHKEPDGTHRALRADGDGYVGPQMVYEPGSPPCGPASGNGTFTCELNGWQALDVTRQRYGIEDSDYGRQSNQQLVLEAILDQAFSRDVVTSPATLDEVLQAGGDALLFDGRGHDPVDYAFALRDIRPGNLVHLNVEGGAVNGESGYLGEELTQETYGLFEAVRQGTIDAFLRNHPDLRE